MSIQVLPSGGSISGRIGRAFGQGLSEQLPKEVERYRLSEGLKNLKNNPQQSPLDQLISLYSTAGVTPEMAQQLAPLLNQAAQKQNRQNKREKTPATKNLKQSQSQTSFENPLQAQFENQNNQGSVSNQTQTPNQTTRLNKPVTAGIPTSAAQQAAVTPVYKQNPEEIRARADELINHYGYGDDQAMAQAQAEAETNYANAKENQELAGRQNVAETNLKTKLDQKIQNKTHKTPTADSLFQTVPGEVYERARQKAENLVLNGMTDTQAANEISEQINNMDKNITTMRNQLGSRPLFGKTPTQLRKDLETLKKPFADSGELETFKNEQINNLDIGDHLACFQTWKPNKNIEKVIVDTSENDSPEKIAAKIAPLITDDDSIFSIGFLLNKIGADDVKVIAKLQDMQNNGLLPKTNERQLREFSEYYPMEYGLGDVLWSSLTELTPGPALIRYLAGIKSKVPATEKVKRYFGKE